MIYALVMLSHSLRSAGVPLSATLLGLLVAESLVPAATALAVAGLVDQVAALTGSVAMDGVVAALLVFVIVLLVGHLAEAMARALEFLLRARVNGAHRSRVVRLVNEQSTIGALEVPEVQRLLRAVSADPENLVDYTPADGALGMLRVVTGLVGLTASSLVLVQYSWWLVPVLVGPALVIWLLRNWEAFSLVGKLRLAYREEMFADVWRRTTVSPSEGKDVRVFGMAEWMVNRMDYLIVAANSPFWEHVMRVIKNRWWQMLIVLAGLIPAYMMVTASAVSGATTVAIQTAVFSAGWSLFLALGSSEDIQRMVGAVHVLRRTDALVEHLGAPNPVVPMPRDPLPTTAPPPEVRFENVGFTYPSADRPVLNGVDLCIHPGELLAVVGVNGAGKSTLIKLLSGLYRPTEGRITVDGVDIDELGPQRWRSLLSVVFQDFIRYPFSTADNVALGKANVPVDQAALVRAGLDAGLDQVVDRLPSGWDTMLTRSRAGGVDLSGGQWQQVVLARSLYAVNKGARLLVLDEPTAHLDVRTELSVFAQLAAHRGGTSVMLISHRLSTVRQADRIVLLDGGRIAESGTHDELIALDGTYARMFAIQGERFRRGYDDRIDEGELL